MRSPFSSSWPVWLLALCSAGVPAVASGQLYGEGARRQQPEVPRENLRTSGTVKAAQRGVIQLITESGEQWLVQVQAARPQDVIFTGTADASFVKPGMWVRFQTKLSRRGDAAEPVTSLEIFTIREGYAPGIMSDSASAGSGNANELFGDAPKPEAKPKAKPKANDEDTVYTVAGQISKISRLGELTINAGSTVKAKLADDAKVRLDVSHLNYLQAGDKIEIQGWYPRGQKGRAVATVVTASGAQPLTDSSKKRKPPVTGDKPSLEANGEKPAEDAETKNEKADGPDKEAL